MLKVAENCRMHQLNPMNRKLKSSMAPHPNPEKSQNRPSTSPLGIKGEKKKFKLQRFNTFLDPIISMGDPGGACLGDYVCISFIIHMSFEEMTSEFAIWEVYIKKIFRT